jgi:hypothetical protein
VHCTATDDRGSEGVELRPPTPAAPRRRLQERLAESLVAAFLENEAVLDRMAARLKAKPEILDRRREMVEHPFGSIKQWMNQGAFQFGT